MCASEMLACICYQKLCYYRTLYRRRIRHIDEKTSNRHAAKYLSRYSTADREEQEIRSQDRYLNTQVSAVVDHRLIYKIGFSDEINSYDGSSYVMLCNKSEESWSLSKFSKFKFSPQIAERPASCAKETHSFVTSALQLYQSRRRRISRPLLVHCAYI